MYRYLFAAGLGLAGFFLGKHIDDQKSTEKDDGTPLAPDAGTVPLSASDDSDKVSEESHKPTE